MQTSPTPDTLKCQPGSSRLSSTDTLSSAVTTDVESQPGTSSSDLSKPSSLTSNGKTKELEAPKKFVKGWLTRYPTIGYDEDMDLMFCKVCRKYKPKSENTMVKGTRNFRTSTITRHFQQDEHIYCLEADQPLVTIPKVVDKYNEAKEKATINLMKLCYWLAKEDIATSKIESLTELTNELQESTLSALRKENGDIAYAQRDTAAEFQEAIADEIRSDISEKLRKSVAKSVLADESTDITVEKKLCIYVKILNNETFKPETHFLANVKIHDGKARTIYDAIVQILEAKGVDTETLTALGSDGASVMTGKKNGVIALFKSKNDKIIQVHCLAHRLNLATSQAADKVKAMKEFQELLTSIFYFFKHSSVNCEKVKDVQKLLDEPQLKYKEVFSVRWFSFYSALETVFRTWDSLVTFLAENDHNAKAKGLARKLCTYNNVAVMYMMMDIIPHMTQLCLTFQKRDLDIALVPVTIDRTKATLQEMIDGQHQPNFEGLQNEITENDDKYFLKGHQIFSADERAKSCFKKAKREFLENLIQNSNQDFLKKALMS